MKMKPSDAIKDPGLDGYFKKAEKEMQPIYIKYEGKKRYVLYDGFVSDKDGWKEYDKEEDFSKHMNKPITPIKIFYSQPMHDKTEEEIKDGTSRLDNYIYGILMYGGFKQEDIERIEIIDNLHHEGLDADAGRLKHLGASIQLMEDADLIIFDKDWDKAKGCRIEKEIVETYTLLWLDTGMPNFTVLLSNWFERFLERENVSK